MNEFLCHLHGHRIDHYAGKEACIAIRDYEAKNHLDPIPIVAVTGNCNPDEVKEYKEAGMQEVIAKPLTKEKAEHFLSFCKD